MTWATKQDVARLRETDRYYAESRWRFYAHVIEFIRGRAVAMSEDTAFLEVGTHKLALNSQSTVVESNVTPELLARQVGNVIMGHIDQAEEMNVLEDKSFDVTICTQVFEHLEDPIQAWDVIKRVTRKGILLTIPWRWASAVHNRDLRDLAAWTRGDLPTELRRIGTRLLAWYTFK